MLIKKLSLTLFIVHFVPFILYSQEADSVTVLSRKALRKERPYYIGLTYGENILSYRDFATSPLKYSGAGLYLGSSRIKLDEKRERIYGLSLTVGKTFSSINDHDYKSLVISSTTYYSQLYQIPKWSTEKRNIKVGGRLDISNNTRINRALHNNAVGIEYIPTLFGSVKGTWDISRKHAIDKKFLFIKYTKEAKTRDLAFRLNVGLINSSYRNGYIYTQHSSVLNDLKIFGDYQFNVFLGFRMSSALDYTVSLKNKNKIQLSYLWDAYKTGGDLDKLEVASHTIKYTLFFNLNNE